MFQFSNGRCKYTHAKETFTIFQICENCVWKEKLDGTNHASSYVTILQTVAPPTAATNWGFKVKLWMISLSVMQQVMETAMSRLKLTAAENTWRWSGSNGLPGRTAELLLSLLCGRKLRRFLNGEYGRDGWRDKVKEHGMDGEEQEMNMQWLRSLSS